MGMQPFSEKAQLSSSYMYDFMCMFSLRKSNWANLNPTTAQPLAMAMQGGQAPCRRMHPCGPLPESGQFIRTPQTPPSVQAWIHS